MEGEGGRDGVEVPPTRGLANWEGEKGFKKEKKRMRKEKEISYFST